MSSAKKLTRSREAVGNKSSLEAVKPLLTSE
jgi:hypothetical protein